MVEGGDSFMVDHLIDKVRRLENENTRLRNTLDKVKTMTSEIQEQAKYGANNEDIIELAITINDCIEEVS